jgi:hypothetical protein
MLRFCANRPENTSFVRPIHSNAPLPIETEKLISDACVFTSR